MQCQWYRIHDACSVIDTACTVHAVSLIPHAKYDTACTIDEWFERPWQPLKVIFIKNIFDLKHPILKKYWSKYGSPLFLNFCSILLKLAHDIRVANIDNKFLNKIIHSKRSRILTTMSEGQIIGIAILIKCIYLNKWYYYDIKIIVACYL
jgi:hypothetical protein